MTTIEIGLKLKDVRNNQMIYTISRKNFLGYVLEGLNGDSLIYTAMDIVTKIESGKLEIVK